MWGGRDTFGPRESQIMGKLSLVLPTTALPIDLIAREILKLHLFFCTEAENIYELASNTQSRDGFFGVKRHV